MDAGLVLERPAVRLGAGDSRARVGRRGERRAQVTRRGYRDDVVGVEPAVQRAREESRARLRADVLREEGVVDELREGHARDAKVVAVRSGSHERARAVDAAAGTPASKRVRYVGETLRRARPIAGVAAPAREHELQRGDEVSLVHGGDVRRLGMSEGARPHPDPHGGAPRPARRVVKGVWCGCALFLQPIFHRACEDAALRGVYFGLLHYMDASLARCTYQHTPRIPARLLISR